MHSDSDSESFFFDECRSGLEAELTSAHRHLGAPLTVITRLTANSGGQETATNPSPFSAPLLYQLFSAGPLKTVKPGGHQRCWSAPDRPASPVGEGWMMMEWCKNRGKKSCMNASRRDASLKSTYLFSAPHPTPLPGGFPGWSTMPRRQNSLERPAGIGAEWSNKPTLAASDHARRFNNADATGQPPQQSTVGTRSFITVQF